MQTAVELQLELKKARKKSYELQRQLSLVKNKIELNDMVIAHQSASLDKALQENKKLKKQIAALKKQMAAKPELNEENNS